ncbi:MAG: FIST signal transduction protein [Thermacetogeniaceae bacterium]
MQVGVGLSSADDAETAGQLAAEQAVQHSGRPVFSIVFSTEGYDPEAVLSGVKKAVGDSKILGASMPGIIAGFRLFEKGVGVCAIAGRGIDAITHLMRSLSESPYKNGAELGRALAEKGGKSPGTLLLIPDGSVANISSLLRGLHGALGRGFDYLGGGSGSNLSPRPSYQYTEEGVASGAVAAALIRGVSFRTALGHGWQPGEEPVMVTRSEGRIVHELDGIPAFERYSALVKGVPREGFPRWAMRYPLGLPACGGDFLIRDPLDVLEDGSILFATEVPANTIAVVMSCDAESLAAAAERVAQQALQQNPAPKLVLVCDCVSRYLLLGSSFQRELEALARNTPGGVPVFGALTFGEISSISGPPLFYNKTLVVAAGW